MRGFKKFILSAALCAVACSAVFASTVFAAESKPTKITVEIDYGDYSGFDLPVGRAGKSYPVFACKATDDLGEEVNSVRITVKNPLGETVVVNNGRFDTLTEGDYTIEYIAEKDALYASKTITINVGNNASDPYYVASENIPAAISTGFVVMAENGVYGGGVGDLTVETSLNFGEEIIDLTETENGYYFIPEKRGEYVLSYTVTDFVNATTTVNKTITAEDSPYPVLEKPSLPQTAIEGETLVLPLVDGVLYKDGAKYYLPVKTYLGDTDISQSMKAENLAAGETVVRYECVNPADSTKKAVYEFTVKVNEKTTDGKMIFDKYFALNNFRSGKSENGSYILTAEEGATYASFGFSRALPADYLNFGLSAAGGKANYTALYMSLTDSRNAADTVRIKIKKLASYDNLYLEYDDVDKTIKNFMDDSVIAQIKTYADGRSFDGFGSGSAFVSFEVEEIRGDVEFSLTNVGSNNITTDDQDYAPPLFLSNSDFKTIFVSYIGRKVYLPAMKAFDLLDSTPGVTLKVTAPDKSVVYNGSGDYSLEIKQSGNYRVEYLASDANGNTARKVATVYALDAESPVIKVSAIKATVTVGEEITLPEAEITDNATATEDIISYVYVLYGNNRKQLVGETYTFKEEGEYKIRYVAYDANQNYTVTEFTVICKQGGKGK